MTPNEYLTACRDKLKIKSDYELARRLKWNKQGISNVRKNRQAMPSEVAFRMADVLGLAHSVVWADIEAHQEKDPKKRAYWEEFLQRAAVFMLAVGIGAGTLPSNAEAAAPLTANTDYAKSWRAIRRAYRALKAALDPGQLRIALMPM